MTKVLIVGDTHADARFVANIHKAAKGEGVDTIVQLGDFGYTFPRDLMTSIYAWLDGDESRLWYWIDGNHDEHNYIEHDIIGDRPTNEPIPHFHDRMFYCPRGSAFTIGSKNCLALGGAYSIDKHYRRINESWWPQEMIRPADVLRAIHTAENYLGGIDVMFTHDSPNHEWLVAELLAHGYKVDRDSDLNRGYLTAVVEEVRPKVLYHGHYHWRYTENYVSDLDGWIVRVEGVGANVAVKMSGQYLDPTARRNHNYIIEEW